MSRNNYWILSFLIVAFLNSCDSNRVFDEYKSIPSNWHKDSIVSFKFSPPDTIRNYNLFVNLRNNNEYKYSNLMLIVALEYPNGKTEQDTLEYQMAKPNGEFLGNGFSDVKENKLWLKGYDKDYKFDETGEYRINIQQAMRENGKVEGITNLDGIMSVGFRIEYTN